jgi:DNA helicase-2/ATP-dependent DNA helicase PcrA
MTEQQLLSWLNSQQSTLDQIIYKAGLDFYNQNEAKPNFDYDIGECQSESYNLINNQDLCYDRSNTAFAYSLWYHARRVNTFLTFFAKQLLHTKEPVIEIFDLGAGTGAVQWSVGLVIQAMKENRLVTPIIKIVNIDSSPFMLQYSRDFLWKHFCSKYSYCKQIEVEYEVNSWNNNRDLSITNPWLCASYLFDISDDKEIIKKDFLSLVSAYNPSTVLLLTSAQPKKKDLLNALSNEFKKGGYRQEEVSTSSLIYKGNLSAVNAFKKELYSKTRIPSIARDASWSDNSFLGTILTKAVQRNVFDTRQQLIKSLSLYNPPLKVRREIELNESQNKAARNDGKPTVIVGPAGCGKSVVITERIKNIVKENKFDPSLRILVTTFNKELVKGLGNWVEELLSVEGKEKFTKTTFTDGSANFSFKTGIVNIQLLHFEMLAKKIGNIRYLWYDEVQHKNIIQTIINQLKSENKALNSSYDSVLTPDFILEEYHRVIYGLECYEDADYLEVIREGRGNNPTLQRNSQRRRVVLECIKSYKKHLVTHNLQSYVIRRRELLWALEKGKVNTKFDYVIVDEFQDCTNADFKIFVKLLKNSDNLILAGDLAQSIHIGKSSKVYRDISMSKREFHRLKGSYRLPVRISEAIENIPKAIAKMRSNEEGVNEITPYKGSPPGARPLIVYADTLLELVQKIKLIFDTYKVYDLKHITVLEKDPGLASEINRVGISSDTDTILRLKGLEKECILWSTRAHIEFDKEVYEFIYTILTRTSSILIIALFKETKPIYKRVINLLRRDRIIFWDAQTKQKFNEFCEHTEIEILEDEG